MSDNIVTADPATATTATGAPRQRKAPVRLPRAFSVFAIVSGPEAAAAQAAAGGNGQVLVELPFPEGAKKDRNSILSKVRALAGNEGSIYDGKQILVAAFTAPTTIAGRKRKASKKVSALTAEVAALKAALAAKSACGG